MSDGPCLLFSYALLQPGWHPPRFYLGAFAHTIPSAQRFTLLPSLYLGGFASA